MKRALLVVVLLAGCVRNDGRYCDSSKPCSDPNFPICDPVAHECQTALAPVDLAMSFDLSANDDLSVEGDLAGVDLQTPPDLQQPDLLPEPDLLPACTSSTTCVDPAVPICDPTAQICRACSGAGDDTACALHGAGLHCKLSGTNAGQCAACNVNNDCPAATPICNPDGTCRKCTAHSDCASGVCDLRVSPAPTPVPTNGQCVTGDNIVYVDNTNTTNCGSSTEHNGTLAKPYCQVNDALGALSGKAFVHVAETATTYKAITLTTSTTAYVVGVPGGSGLPNVDTTGNTNSHTVEVNVTNNNRTADLTVDGFNINGDNTSSGSAVWCDNSATSGSKASITVRNSVITGGFYGANILKCNGTLSEDVITGTESSGFVANTNSTYDVRNTIIHDCPAAGFYAAGGSGTFRFNTLSANGTGATAGGAACTVAATLDSCIVYGNTATAGGSQFIGSCTLANTVSGENLTGNLSGTPTFTSTFHLKLDTTPALQSNIACCIDKVAPNGTTIDIDHDPRPKVPSASATSADVGADEAL